jgi:hypothetical protein
LGNSPEVIHRHYRALLTHDEAASWFVVRPDTADKGKIVAFDAAS